ncbi:EAL and HDOD domain-containing protein [Zhongshania aliphaticivorans]|uniref:Signal transduction protein n=1 Tax=Zhongshania aliphaticivorans TaxID=1470434 RepID=A0A127M5N5_9GAMM|nr:HDOD domain-containing protein [Zhongshania aliphaticivorans]AMO68535.1 signal transduction protein [Zhongshania aliphaticivorans]
MSDSSTLLMARQPILDRYGKTVAYELLCRSVEIDSLKSQNENGTMATGEVLIGAFHDLGIDAITNGLPAFVNLTESWLCNPPAVQAQQLVCEVLEYISATPANIEAVQQLRKLGFKVALDDYIGDPEQGKWLPYVDIVKVDISDLLPGYSSASLLQQHQRDGLIWLAEKVETVKEFERCKEEGYSLFQGFFFSRPAPLFGKRNNDSQFAVMRLLKVLSNDENTMLDISSAIQSDPQLSYRILQFMNSASVAKVTEITSVHHAATMAGVNRIKSWATMLALGRLDHKPRALLEQALSRAYLCQLLAQKHGDADQHTAYTTGMFSLLDAFIDIPLEDVCSKLGLSATMTAALLDHSGAYGEILDLAIALSKGNWPQITALSPDISLADLADIQSKAFTEVSQQLRLTGLS